MSINKLRHDVKEDYTKIESYFFNVSKIRGTDICARDKLKWYTSTEQQAQVNRHALLRSFAFTDYSY
jgi:hypothetical protein